MLGDLIDALEALREKHDSACAVAIEDADTRWLLAIQTVEYDPEEDRVVLAGDYHATDGILAR